MMPARAIASAVIYGAITAPGMSDAVANELRRHVYALQISPAE